MEDVMSLEGPVLKVTESCWCSFRWRPEAWS